MDEQGSQPLYAAPTGWRTQAPALPQVPSTPMLRPLSTGEVLDRTFVLYRRRFWLFASIGAMPAAVLSLLSIARLVYLALTHRTDTLTTGATNAALVNVMSTMAVMQAYFLPATLLFVVAYGVSHAAIVDAVGSLSRGQPASVAEAYRQVRGRWLRWVGIALRQFWSAAWPVIPGASLAAATVLLITRAKGNAVLAGLLLLLAWLCIVGGVVWGILNFLRNALAMPAGVQEDLGVNRALRRSRALVSRRKGRIFLALLLVYALQMVVSAVQVPLLFLVNLTRGAEHVLLQITQLVVQFVAVTLVSPVASIALCLFYFDERVRREGYDIELLMQRSFSGATVTASASASSDPASSQ